MVIHLNKLQKFLSLVNCTSATWYDYDETITFFSIAQLWTSDTTTISIYFSAIICTQPPAQQTGLLGIWMQHGDL